MADNIAITLASESEAPACIMLLPEARDIPAEFLIARSNGEFAGAAAIAWRNWSNPGGFPLGIHVLPRHRRQGAGRALLSYAASLSAADTGGFWPMRPVPEDSAAALFMQACGFTLHRRHHFFQARVDALLENVSPLIARLRKHGRIPAEAQIVPLENAPLDEIGWLVSAELGGGPFRMLQLLQRRLKGGAANSHDRSIAAIQGSEVAGALIWHIEDREGKKIAAVEARVVAPRHRNGWPNLVMLEAGLLRCRTEGVTEFAFDCDDTVRDTLSLARRSDASEVAKNALYYYAVTADD